VRIRGARAAGGETRIRALAELTLEGKGAIYSFDLPVDVYKGLERRDLGDLRVQNAAAESVPHALVLPALSERKPAASVTLPYFPVLGAAGKPVEDMTLRVERKPDGTVKAVVSTGERNAATARSTVAYVLDASASKAALRELRFDWQPESDSASLDLRIEASDDLRSWRSVGSGALIRLKHGDAVLDRSSIQLSPTRADYFRISWRGQEPWKLTGITAMPVDAVAQSPRTWLACRLLQVPSPANMSSSCRPAFRWTACASSCRRKTPSLRPCWSRNRASGRRSGPSRPRFCIAWSIAARNWSIRTSRFP
jgi:hypothetical protein